MRPRSEIILALFLFLIIGVFILQLHNLWIFPVNRGFDAQAHSDYVGYIKTLHKLPQPYEGWEMWQAPLYYFTASMFPNTNSVRVIHLASWLALLFISYLSFRYLFRKPILALTATFLATSLPVVLYATPGISNEFFSSVLISAALVYYILNRNLKTIKSRFILGILLGLSLLAKATSWIIFTAIIADIIISYRRKLISIPKKILPVIIIALLISGWFYFKNFLQYKNPFITSTDFPNYAYTEKPWDRSIRFFTDLGAFAKLDLFKAHHYSFLGGTYFSWFYDGHNNLVPVQPFSKAGNLLTLFSLPIAFAFLTGLIKEIRKVNDKNRILIMYPVLLFLSYLLYNLKIPYYSTVKGLFLISAVIPFVYFSVKGFSNLLLKHRLIYLIYLLIYGLLIFKNFWIIPSWYH